MASYFPGHFILKYPALSFDGLFAFCKSEWNNYLGDNIYTIKKNTQTLIDAGKEVGLEVNIEKTKYMLLSRHQNAGKNPDIKIGNRCF
jgi:hypothetical protein